MGKRTILCVLLGIALAACGGEGDFSPSGNMNAPRHGHTATRLESGEIFIAAGLTKTSPLDDFEIFDPAQGTFKPYKIGGLRKRGWHKALLLKDGVLITGGWTNRRRGAQRFLSYKTRRGASRTGHDEVSAAMTTR